LSRDVSNSAQSSPWHADTFSGLGGILAGGDGIDSSAPAVCIGVSSQAVITANRHKEQAFHERKAHMGGDQKFPFDTTIFLATADRGKTISRHEANQSLFSQGDPADSVFYIQKGTVKVTVLSEQGKEAVIAMLGVGDFCGEKCLAGEATRTAAATTMSDCIVVRIDKAIIVRLIHEQPAFAERLISHLLDRNIRIESDLVDQLFNSTEKRLARLLLILANFGKEGRPEPIVPMISQETMAETIGTTRSRVNFFMNKFRQLGFIDYNGTLKVRSSLLSVVLNEQPRDKH
jgi:CRP/FNR family cyclic AMP-dependent transcriptional regulator